MEDFFTIGLDTVIHVDDLPKPDEAEIGWLAVEILEIVASFGKKGCTLRDAVAILKHKGYVCDGGVLH